MTALETETKMVKCLVCNAVFEAGPAVCPVCGAPSDQFVPIAAAESGFQRNTGERFVILGGGTAAVNAAKAIRERNRTADIWMIYDEPTLPYNRPMLTKMMLTEISGDKIAIFDRDWYTDNEIRRVEGTAVTGLDTDGKRVMFGDGEIIPYDKCIYALGSYSFVPPIQGAEPGERLRTIRKLGDVQAVKNRVDGGARDVVVVGGGVLGLETAWELSKVRCNVTVIDNNPVLLARKIAPKVSDALLGAATEYGIKVLLSSGVTAISEAAGRSQVQLSDGTVLPADLVVVSAGVRPNVGIAKQAGLAVERAVVVDAGMRTSAAGVFACGDCAELAGVNYCLWSEATGQGKVAGAVAAGDVAEYESELPAVTLNVLGRPLYALGDNGSNPEKAYRCIERPGSGADAMEIYYFFEDRLCGATLFGDVRRMKTVLDDVHRKAAIGEICPDQA